VTVALLDVSVLVASIDEGHVAYKKVHAWLRESGGKPWATCPLTEAGFVRIIANPIFHPEKTRLVDALALLANMTLRPGHRFWPVNIGFAEAVEPFQEKLVGHQQVADAYLLGLAIKNKGRLITLDSGIETLAGKEFAHYVTLLR